MSADGPPVDEPMATSTKFPAPADASSTLGWDARPSAVRRPAMCVMTRTRARTFTRRMMSRPIRSRSSQSRGSGFLMTSSAPALSASNAYPMPGATNRGGHDEDRRRACTP